MLDYKWFNLKFKSLGRSDCLVIIASNFCFFFFRLRQFIVHLLQNAIALLVETILIVKKLFQSFSLLSFLSFFSVFDRWRNIVIILQTDAVLVINYFGSPSESWWKLHIAVDLTILNVLPVRGVQWSLTQITIYWNAGVIHFHWYDRLVANVLQRFQTWARLDYMLLTSCWESSDLIVCASLGDLAIGEVVWAG